MTKYMVFVIIKKGDIIGLKDYIIIDFDDYKYVRRAISTFHILIAYACFRKAKYMQVKPSYTIDKGPLKEYSYIDTSVYK